MRFNTFLPEPSKVLTIAGSDTGGADGLQGNLKSLTTLGACGMSVVIVLTAQHCVGINAIQPLPASIVSAQPEATLSDYGASAVLI